MAAVFADRIIRATDTLARHPALGRIVPERNVKDIREIIVGNYRVIYWLRQDEVQILTVHHGARLLDASRLPPDD